MKIVTTLIGLLAIGITGCVPETDFQTYEVSKAKSGLESLRKNVAIRKNPELAPKPKKNRMVVAWFDQPDATWFFKLNGPEDQVNLTQPQWRPFFDTVEFVGGKPSYEIPEGWTEAGPRPMRYKTLLIGSEKNQIEMAISGLPPKQGRLKNLNRWLGQIGLSSIGEEEVETKLVNKGKFFLFDQVGEGSGTMSAPRFARQTLDQTSNQTGTTAGDSRQMDPRQSGVTFDSIEGWESGRTSSITKARFIKKNGEKQAMITLIEMPAAVNDWKPNVIRWAGQVDFKPSQDELAKRTSKIKVDNIEGQIIDLISDDESLSDGTIAAMVKHKESAWFLKLTGDKELVSESESDFRNFIDSIRFN
ncbi:MAG: hypothetical protein AAF623_07105 [Planctomycetota bacterium]